MAQHINREKSPKRQPVTCIPVTWSAFGVSWLAYHHGWIDARLYSVVGIPKGRAQDFSLDYVAAVDDFGDLVPITHRPWIQRGALELH